MHDLNTRYVVAKDYTKDYLDLKVVASHPTAIIENLPATADVSIPSLNKITFGTIFNNQKKLIVSKSKSAINFQNSLLCVGIMS